MSDLAAGLLSDDLETRLAAIAGLGAAGTASPAALDALADSLGHARKPVQRRAAETFAALAGAGVAVHAWLERSLAAESLRGRWGAAYALSLLGAPPAACLPVLLETLADPDGDLRWAAAGIVLRMREDPAVEPALVRLLGGAGAAGRKMALYCLRDLPAASAAAHAAAIGALGDPDVGVRLAAVATVATLSRTDAAGHVVALLDDPDAGVRRATAAALARLAPHGPAVRDALERAARRDDPVLQRIVLRALGRDQ